MVLQADAYRMHCPLHWKRTAAAMLSTGCSGTAKMGLGTSRMLCNGCVLRSVVAAVGCEEQGCTLRCSTH